MTDFDRDSSSETLRPQTASSPPEDVSLYLSTLLWQDPETWAGLSEVPELRGTTTPAAT